MDCLGSTLIQEAQWCSRGTTWREEGGSFSSEIGLFLGASTRVMSVRKSSSTSISPLSIDDILPVTRTVDTLRVIVEALLRMTGLGRTERTSIRRRVPHFAHLRFHLVRNVD